MLTVTPPSCDGNGTMLALEIPGASDDPKIVSTAPGAKPCRNEAPFVIPAIVGAPVAAVTLIVIDAPAGL